ncbi:SRPBCC family protein [Hydrogenophaga sp.]|uniref:SRPBCC family protein n=1 Tax=Hydrogenophaga sp. TaxID=1904254 RepID=UPI00272025F3|nr:SRPBCC family protein [Hydrogenophaga sp.]MDO9435526.1 SRPBCC family protein [Hydrogenophaga sp.]
MQFTNSFEVSLPPEEAWPLLMDLPVIVPCMPGAELVEQIDARKLKAKVSVRLGPVGLVFLCDAEFTELDDVAHKATVQATGADAKGRGTAQASIDFWCQPSAVGSKILITTDLALSGAVAQYGRGAGLIQNVANQIIQQFARNLEIRIGQIKAHAKAGGAQASSELSALPSMERDQAFTSAPREPVSMGNTGAGSDAFTQGFRQGFGAGFSSGHAAGMAAAVALQRAGQPVVLPGELPPLPPSQPIGGLSLIFSSLWATVRGWFGGRAN